jgi:hypothetical protein
MVGFICAAGGRVGWHSRSVVNIVFFTSSNFLGVYMNVADAFHHTVMGSPGGAESLAPRMGMSAHVLRNKANIHTTTNIPSLSDIDKVMGLTGDYQILHALAANHGFVCFQHGDATPASDMAVLELIAKVWSTNGEVGAAVNQTLADGRVDQHELAHVRQAVYRTTAALMEMMARLEGMAEK